MVKNKASMTLIPICRVTALSSRSVGIDDAKLHILFLFFLLKQKKITNCLEYCREMPIFATCNRLQSLARARKEKPGRATMCGTVASV
jgi:hypothetical protein